MKLNGAIMCDQPWCTDRRPMAGVGGAGASPWDGRLATISAKHAEQTEATC